MHFRSHFKDQISDLPAQALLHGEQSMGWFLAIELNEPSLFLLCFRLQLRSASIGAPQLGGEMMAHLTHIPTTPTPRVLAEFE
jgi:hypothetical protein